MPMCGVLKVIEVMEPDRQPHLGRNPDCRQRALLSRAGVRRRSVVTANTSRINVLSRLPHGVFLYEYYQLLTA